MENGKKYRGYWHEARSYVSGNHTLALKSNRPMPDDIYVSDVVWLAPYESACLRDVMDAYMYLNSEGRFKRRGLSDLMVGILEDIRREAAQRFPELAIWLPEDAGS